MTCCQCCRADCRVMYWRCVVARGDARNAEGFRVARDHQDALTVLSSAELLCGVRRTIRAEIARASQTLSDTRTRLTKKPRR